MERRTFIAGTGIGVGIGIAGCLNTGTDAQEGNETELETDGGEEVAERSDDEPSEATRNDSETDADDGDESGNGDEPAPARFEVTAMSTNSPIGPRGTLTVDATIENVGDESGTTDVELVVGHTPSVEDGRTLTLESGETADVTLEFTAGDPADGREEFPVRVDTGAHEVSETAVVTEDDGEGDDDSEDGDAPAEGVTFDSCTRATVSGSFEDGDVAYASTLFYDEVGVGDTLIEDGLTVGEDVDAPFTGTIVFEIAAESGLEENGDEIVVRVPDYGEYGTVISGLTTDEDDYAFAGVTHSNPHAEDCLEEIEAEWEAATGN